jgi:hypothetical protein
VSDGAGRRIHPLRRTAGIVAHPPLSGPTSLPKRVIRLLLRWYLPPVAGQVSAHNRAIADVIEEHRRSIVWTRMETERLDRDAAMLGMRR